MKQRMSTVARTLAASGLTLAGCAQSHDVNLPEPTEVEGVASELIGGVEANSPTLDAIGVLGVTSSYFDCYTGTTVTQERPVCTASLIGPRTVLTAKHCVDGLNMGNDAQPFFAMGPDFAHPIRKVEVIDIERSPVDVGGFSGLGRDVAVVHLASTVDDVRPLRIAELTPAAIGTRFGAIGYGLQDNGGTSGTRRAGNVTVNALEGRAYELIFGSFEAYREWFLSVNGGFPGLPILADAPGEVPDGSVSVDGGVLPVPVDGGSLPPPPSFPDGGYPDFIESYLRSSWEQTLLLPGYEAYVGNRPGDAQLCNGDSGGPLVQAVDGELVAYGVVSGGLYSRELICDLGAIYATFGPESIDFLTRAISYTDPCEGVTRQGTCSGSVATRCTAFDEGKRRLTVTDCALLGQTCAMTSNGEAACAALGEVPVIVPPTTPDFCQGFPGRPVPVGGIIIDQTGVEPAPAF